MDILASMIMVNAYFRFQPTVSNTNFSALHNSKSCRKPLSSPFFLPFGGAVFEREDKSERKSRFCFDKAVFFVVKKK